MAQIRPSLWLLFCLYGLSDHRPSLKIYSIQYFHICEIGVTKPHNNDTQRQVAAVDDFWNGIIHIIDLSIRQDEQNDIVIWAFLLHGHGTLFHLGKQWAKKGGSWKVALVDRWLVNRQGTLNAMGIRVVHTTCEREAMAHLFEIEAWKMGHTTKTIHLDKKSTGTILS